MQAAQCLFRAGDAVKAQEFLEQAKLCFTWCDWSFTKAGTNMIQKDIDSEICKTVAENCCNEAFEAFRQGETHVNAAKELMEKAVVEFKKGGASMASASFNSACIVEGIKAGERVGRVRELLEKEDWEGGMKEAQEIVEAWKVVAGISITNNASVQSFIEYFGMICKQLSGVVGMLKKWFAILAEVKKNKWQKPEALGLEVVAIMKSLEKEGGGLELEY